MVVSFNSIKINKDQYKHSVKPNFSENNGINFCSNVPLKLNSPDLKQYNLPNVGEYYCGPVSAANAIVMMSQKGFPNLYNGNSMNLINELAKVFKTTQNGTTTSNLSEGLKSFVETKGYRANIKYQGFREVNPAYKSSNIPDLNWIKSEINNNHAVLLNLGIYKKSFQNGKAIYTRLYGHFVTATGCGHNGLTNDPNYLSIHDPYNRANGNHFIKVTQIKDGKFIHNPSDDEISLTNDANGFLEVSQKFNYFTPDEVAIVNGAVSLDVNK